MHGSQWMGLNEPVNPLFFSSSGPWRFSLPNPSQQTTYLFTHTLSLSLNPPPHFFQILNRQGLGGSERVGHQTEVFWPLDFIKKKNWKKKKNFHVPPPHLVSCGGRGRGEGGGGLWFGFASFSPSCSLVFFFLLVLGCGLRFWGFGVSCHPVIYPFWTTTTELNWAEAKWCDWYRNIGSCMLCTYIHYKGLD